MKVRVVAYNGRLVIVPIEPEKDIENGWFPTGGNRIGCVVLDTKNSLGVSEEAFELMQKIQRNRDSMGDISWWACHDGTHAFSWFGSVHRVIDPNEAEGDRDFRVSSDLKQHCTMIPNEVPDAAKQALDANSAVTSWAEPSEISA